MKIDDNCHIDGDLQKGQRTKEGANQELIQLNTISDPDTIWEK